MRLLIIDTYYPAFLESFYRIQPNLAERNYQEQWHTLMDQSFGTADFYSANLRKLGHEATEIVANCQPLQLTWAREHGLSLKYKMTHFSYHRIPLPRISKDWVYPVLFAQVRAHRPEVIHFQDPVSTAPYFLRDIRPYVPLITAQIACPISTATDLTPYDLILSSFPHYVDRFKREGIPSEYFNLAFEPRLLERLNKTRERDVVFVGGVSPDHGERIRFLEQIARHVTLDWWGYGVEHLKSDSVLRRSHREPLWALAMYNTLHNARIALNHHIDVAGNYANNMRLFEATGVGTCLLTDRKDNLDDFFSLGKEVLAYSSAEECIELISFYLAHEKERKAIAEAGQARTLQQHTYFHRMEQFAKLAEDYLRRTKRP